MPRGWWDYRVTSPGHELPRSRRCLPAQVPDFGNRPVRHGHEFAVSSPGAIAIRPPFLPERHMNLGNASRANWKQFKGKVKEGAVGPGSTTNGLDVIAGKSGISFAGKKMQERVRACPRTRPRAFSSRIGKKRQALDPGGKEACNEQNHSQTSHWLAGLAFAFSGRRAQPRQTAGPGSQRAWTRGTRGTGGLAA